MLADESHLDCELSRVTRMQLTLQGRHWNSGSYKIRELLKTTHITFGFRLETKIFAGKRINRDNIWPMTAHAYAKKLI